MMIIAWMQIRRFLPIIGIILFFYILTTLEFQEIFSLFKKIPTSYLALSFFSIVPIVLITNLEWQVILKKHSINLSFSDSLKNIFIGFFYGFITPGGIGAYTRVLYFQRKTNESIQKCLSNLILINMIDYLTLLIIGIIGSIIFLFYSTQFLYISLIITFILIIMTSIYYLIIFHRFIIENFLKRLLKNKYLTFLGKYIDDFHLFYEDLPSIKELSIPIIISLIGWILRFYIFYLVAQLFNIQLSFLIFFFIVAIGNIIGSLPITIYGLGTREITLISLFSIFLISQETVITLSLFWFVIVWILPSLIGLMIIIKEDLLYKKKGKDI